MSDMPVGWTIAFITDVLIPQENGKPFSQGWSPQCESSPAQTEEQWGALKTTAIQSGEFLPEHNKALPSHLAPRPQLEVEAGDILITCAGPRNRCGVPCLVRSTRPKLMISGKMYRLRANEKLADPRWLEGVLRSPQIQKRIDLMKTGGSDSGLNLTHERFSGLEIPVPPLPEQRRIVTKIEALMARSRAAREALEQARSLTKQLRTSLLNYAVCGHLTSQWRRERKLMNSEWKSVALGSLIHGIEAGLNFQCEERPPNPGEQGLVKISAVTWGRFREDESKTVPSNRSALPANLKIQQGDFLISRANTLELVGACVIVDSINRDLYLSDKVLRVQIPDVLKKWVLYVLRSRVGREQIEALASGNQLSMRNLSQANLREIVLPMPPDEEISEIVKRLDRAFESVVELELSTSGLLPTQKRLEESILAKAFSGELVPQDPADEPTEALLARIRAERAQVSLAPKGRKLRATASPSPAPSPGWKTQAAPTPSTGEADRAARPDLSALDTDTIMAAFRRTLAAQSTWASEEDLLRAVAQQLGYQRLGSKAKPILQGHLRAALHRRIVERADDGTPHSGPRTLEAYDRDELLAHLPSVMRKGQTLDREDLMRALLAHLGFHRLTEGTREVLKGHIAIAIRRGLLAAEGADGVRRLQ